jgi:hypothetical protein
MSGGITNWVNVALFVVANAPENADTDPSLFVKVLAGSCVTWSAGKEASVLDTAD